MYSMISKTSNFNSKPIFNNQNTNRKTTSPQFNTLSKDSVCFSSRKKPQNIDNKASINFGSQKIATDIAKAIFTHRRPLHDAEPDCAQAIFVEVIGGKVKNYVQKGKPIEFIMAAYPFKSLSREKCVSEHADMAERASLQYIGNVLDDIQKVYEPGAKLTVFSDGYLFSKIEGNPTTEQAAQYASELKRMLEQEGQSQRIKIQTMPDMYGSDVEREQERIISKGETLEQIRDRVQVDDILKNDYCGIKRFITEELGGIESYSGMSRSKRDNLARSLAYQTIQTAEAWSKFLVGENPDAIRFSCHPQNYDSPNKVGIFLAKGKDNWLTPWMGAAVKTGPTEYTLAQNKQAVTLGLSLIVDERGLPSHYEIPADASDAAKEYILGCLKK